MAVIALPTNVGPRDAQLSIERLDFALQMMNGGTVAYTTPHYFWTYTFTLPPQEFDSARIWASRLNLLTSFENVFTAGPPGYEGPSTGYSGPAPKVLGGSQTGFELDCDGVTASAAIALEGDYISFNGEMHQLGADATADGSGNVTFVLCEMMRNSPSDNADVELDNPVATFQLAEASQAFTVDVIRHYGISISAVERYDP